MATEQEIRSEFEMVCNYWGVRLNLVIGELAELEDATGMEEPPRMIWGQVNVSKKVLDGDPDENLLKLGHEVGHRACPDAPQTEPVSILWKTIAAQEEIKYPQFFLNIFCDGLVDRYNIIGHMHGVCPWSAIYKSGEVKILRKIRDKKLLKCVRFLTELDDITLSHYNDKEKFDLDATVKKLKLKDLHAEVYRLLFFDERDIEYRIRDIAKLTKDLFEEKPNKKGKEGVGNSERGQGFMQPLPSSEGVEEGEEGEEGTGKEGEEKVQATQKEVDEILKKLMRLYGGKLNDQAHKELSKLPRAIPQMSIWKAYQNVVPLIESFKQSIRPSGQFSGYSRWSIGMPLRQLDAVHSISKYGALIPGLTTLKQRTDVETGQDPIHGIGVITIILDSSGSMYGEPLDRAIEAAVGLVETARYYHDKFAAIDFSSGMGWHVEPTTNYDDAVDELSRMPGGGTTELYEAAAQALEYAKKETKSATIILSDTDIWDSNRCAKTLGELSKYGKIIVIAIGRKSVDDIYGPMRKVLSGVGAKVYAVPDPSKSFTFEALKELWG